jgi:hypothetical protein
MGPHLTFALPSLSVNNGDTDDAAVLGWAFNTGLLSREGQEDVYVLLARGSAATFLPHSRAMTLARYTTPPRLTSPYHCLTLHFLTLLFHVCVGCRVV